MDTLAVSEKKRLAELEAVVERGLQTFVEVGAALMEIRDSRLYREHYDTFANYCRERWGVQRRRAYQLMDAAAVVGNVKDFSHPPQVESHAAPLSKLDPDDQSAAWQRAVESAPDGRVTGAHVEEIVKEYQAEKNGEKPDGMAVHYSSKHKDWETPQPLFDLLDNEFLFTLDVCATDKTAKCENYFTPEDDGLAQEWEGHRCWMNPPYGDEISAWIEKAYRAAQHKGTLVVCLLPARTDTSWWWDYCRHGQIRFLRGRLKFGGAEHSAPFPSAVVVFDGYREAVIWWEAPNEI